MEYDLWKMDQNSDAEHEYESFKGKEWSFKVKNQQITGGKNVYAHF